jgi:hypothetical protein
LRLIIFLYDDSLIGEHGGETGADISSERLHFGMTPDPGTWFRGFQEKELED